jgi:anti-sigma B factor antagonist
LGTRLSVRPAPWVRRREKDGDRAVGEVMHLTLSDHDADPETRVIELRGEIDLYSAPAFKDRMDEAVASGKRRVVVDLSQVTFCDTTGLWVLVNGRKRLEAGGGSLEVICANEHILRTFEITGVSQLIRIRGRRDEGARAHVE